MRAASTGGEEWWNTEAIRWLHNNLREIDGALDPKQFVNDVADFDANVLVTAMAGITASYPSTVQYEYVNPYMPKGQDTFGEVLREAHARKIRVAGRCDFSKARKDVYDAHPEWFFKRADGQPVVYNGLYQTCVNSGWYRQKAIEILNEALDKYEVDGLFFNMFANPAVDYSYRPIGLCHCDNCELLYRERYHREIPDKADSDYQAFLHDSVASISLTIRNLVKGKRASIMLAGMAPEISDIVYSESNTAAQRPLPLWPYSASDNTNQWRNSYPNKPAVNQCMSFVDFRWRFATAPQPEIRTRLWQDVANGGAAALSQHGTIAKLQDRMAFDAARPIYRWLKDHEDYYVGQKSEARVLLLAPGSGGAGFRMAEDSYRGLFRLLAEQHVPFAAVDNLDWLGKRDADLVISTGLTPRALEAYVENGGRLLIAGSAAPEFEIAPTIKLWKNPDGAYFRIRDKAAFPSLKETDVLFMYGDYLQLRAEGESPITFVPPSMYGPPEFVHIDWKDTEDPGLLRKEIGKGRVAWLPWDIGGLYYRHSSEAHAGLLIDLIDTMLPQGRQLETNAHPLVEITFMRQNDRHLLQLVNLSGHADTAWFDPLRMTNIQLKIEGDFRTGHAVKAGQDVIVSNENGYSLFTLATLDEYELIDLR
jgi:Hypothetical glycosyl hydrolase 6